MAQVKFKCGNNAVVRTVKNGPNVSSNSMVVLYGQIPNAKCSKSLMIALP
ncbi:hypothetical protein BVRB_7g165580 [Beta vulgaris subsp. vulgaris]|nr:hypothetical protein BVRB_7g165580 [Beta vulgaris subsp. vulgaris]